MINIVQWPWNGMKPQQGDFNIWPPPWFLSELCSSTDHFSGKKVSIDHQWTFFKEIFFKMHGQLVTRISISSEQNQAARFTTLGMLFFSGCCKCAIRHFAMVGRGEALARRLTSLGAGPLYWQQEHYKHQTESVLPSSRKTSLDGWRRREGGKAIHGVDMVQEEAWLMTGAASRS